MGLVYDGCMQCSEDTPKRQALPFLYHCQVVGVLLVLAELATDQNSSSAAEVLDLLGLGHCVTRPAHLCVLVHQEDVAQDLVLQTEWAGDLEVSCVKASRSSPLPLFSSCLVPRPYYPTLNSQLRASSPPPLPLPLSHPTLPLKPLTSIVDHSPVAKMYVPHLASGIVRFKPERKKETSIDLSLLSW